MFSFLKFLNSKPDTDKNKKSNSLSGKTLNLNSAEARALNIFHNKSPISRKSNGNNTTLRSKETVISPGFSFRIAQRAREMRSTTPNTDTSILSTSYTLENSMNGNNAINGNDTISRDVYDKKRKLMETLDNFGVRKRTRQENGVDAFVNRRRRTISESIALDRATVINGHNHRSTQPISIVMSNKNAGVENKKTKRQGDFETDMCHLQKKPRTRNNEILSSYSSSKFLITPGQKRPYPTDNEGDSPDRKHCKSCTCCGSTVILENDQNHLGKSDKTTETDLSDDLVTVAASRIFNRSGKTLVVKKICMKTILNEVFDDVDPVPYTSIEKIEAKKKNAQIKEVSVQPCTDKFNVKGDNQSIDATASVSLSLTPKFNEIQPALTSILSSTSPTLSVSSATSVTTPLVQTKTGINVGIPPSGNLSKINEGNLNNTPLQFNFGSPIASIASTVEANSIQKNEIDEKTITIETPGSPNKKMLIKTPNSTIQNSNEQCKLLFQSPEKNIHEKSQLEGQNDSKSAKDTTPGTKSNSPVVNLTTVEEPSKINGNNLSSIQFGSQLENSPKQSNFTFGVTKADNNQSKPVMQFGVPKVEDKQSGPVMQFGAPKEDKNQSTPLMQFGAPKVDNTQSIPVMQFGTSKVDNKQSTPVMQLSKVDDKQSTPVMQFGTPNIVDDKKSTPGMQFGAPKDDKQPTPVMQFGAPKIDDKLSTPVMQFGATKIEDKLSTPVIQFGAPKINDKQSTPVMQFGAPKVDDKQSTSIIKFGETKKSSENLTSTPLFSFGNQNSNENSKPTEPLKFQFGSSKVDSVSLAEPKNVVFASNNLQNPNIFNFGKSDNVTLPTNNPPKYDAATVNSAPKLQFGTLPTPVFGKSNADQSKPQFISVSQSVDNQGSKLVFGGNQITENKPVTSTAGIMFSNNTPNSVFQFSSSSSNLNDKASETSNNSFKFSTVKTAPTFGASTAQDFRDKPAFQFGLKKTEEPKAQFSTPTFGSQSAFKFGGNDNPASYGNSNFSSSSQPVQFSNSTEKTAEPFKFGSTAPSSNAFQFGATKTDSGPLKFGQNSNTFSTPEFTSFGGSVRQQTTTFGSVPQSQPSPFGNMTSVTTPTFGSVATSPSNTFGTNQSFQFGSPNNAPNSSSTFAFGVNTQPTKPDSAFNFNAAAVPPFQFGQAPSTSTPQFGGAQPQGSFGFGSPPMVATGSSQPLFSVGAAPAHERRKAKAVRRRQ